MISCSRAHEIMFHCRSEYPQSFDHFAIPAIDDFFIYCVTVSVNMPSRALTLRVFYARNNRVVPSSVVTEFF